MITPLLRRTRLLSEQLSSPGGNTHSPQARTGNDGIYVSIDQLLALKYHAAAHKRSNSHRLENGLPGEALSILKGRGIEFEDIRPYLPGDDLRHVDWRVAARTGMPFTRRYSEDRERSTLVVADQRVNMFFGSGKEFKSYTAAIAAAKLAWGAVENGHRLGGLIASDTTDITYVGNARRNVLTILSNLVKHNNSLSCSSSKSPGFDQPDFNQPDFNQLLEQVANKLQPGLIVNIVSDFNDLNKQSKTMLATIASSCELNLIRIVDPLEQEINLKAHVGISNGSAIKRARLNNSILNQYRDKRALIERHLNEIVQRADISLVSIKTSQTV